MITPHIGPTCNFGGQNEEKRCGLYTGFYGMCHFLHCSKLFGVACEIQHLYLPNTEFLCNEVDPMFKDETDYTELRRQILIVTNFVALTTKFIYCVCDCIFTVIMAWTISGVWWGFCTYTWTHTCAVAFVSRKGLHMCRIFKHS